MAELNDLKSGLHNLFGDIDYNRVAQSNIYYRKLLNKAEMPKPDFCRDIDDDELTSKLQNTPVEQLPMVAQNYLRFRRLTATDNTTPREQLLVKMRGYVSAYPNDGNLQLAFGIALIKRGFYQDSVRFLQTCVHLQPKNSVAWSLLGLMAALSNDYGNAILYSREALQQGDHYYNTQSKAFAFARLTMSLPSKVGPFNSRLLFDNKRFDPSMATSQIPPVSMELEPETAASTPVIFVACDEDYFDRFAKNLLLSLLEVGTSFAVHLHVVNPSANTIEWMKQYRQHFDGDVYVSREDVSDANLAKKHNVSGIKSVHPRATLYRTA